MHVATRAFYLHSPFPWLLAFTQWLLAFTQWLLAFTQSPHAQQFAHAIHHAQPAPNPWLHWLLAFTHTCPKAPTCAIRTRNSPCAACSKASTRDSHVQFTICTTTCCMRIASAASPALHTPGCTQRTLDSHTRGCASSQPAHGAQHPRHQPTHGLIRAVRCTSALKWRTLAQPAGARAVHPHLVLIALALAQLARALVSLAPITDGTVRAGGRQRKSSFLT